MQLSKSFLHNDLKGKSHNLVKNYKTFNLFNLFFKFSVNLQAETHNLKCARHEFSSTDPQKHEHVSFLAIPGEV